MTTNLNKTPMQSEPRRLLSRRQVGALLGVHPGSVARYERAGRLKSVRINSRTIRYFADEVEKFIISASVANVPK
jgi:predicted site-specific integrase-resolvase